MSKLDMDQVILLHQSLINELGGSHGIRDVGLLDSAICMPYMTFDGIELYPSIEQKAAQLCYGLVKNHPFIDGNKRIGANCMEILLYLNNIELEYNSEEEISDCILAVAEGNMDAFELTQWIISHEAEVSP